MIRNMQLLNVLLIILIYFVVVVVLVEFLPCTLHHWLIMRSLLAVSANVYVLIATSRILRAVTEQSTVKHLISKRKTKCKNYAQCIYRCKTHVLWYNSTCLPPFISAQFTNSEHKKILNYRNWFDFLQVCADVCKFFPCHYLSCLNLKNGMAAPIVVGCIFNYIFSLSDSLSLHFIAMIFILIQRKNEIADLSSQRNEK